MTPESPHQVAVLPWHHQLSVKLGIGVVLILLAALLGAGLWIGHSEQRRFEERETAHAEQVTQMLARALSERMLAGGGAKVWSDVAHLSTELKDSAGAVRVIVMSRGGIVKAASDPAFSGHRFWKDDDVECHTCHRNGMRDFPVATTLQDIKGNRVLRVLNRIEKLPSCAKCHEETEAFRGMIAVDFDPSGPEIAALERNKTFAVIGALAGAGMFLLIWLLLRQMVNKPIDHLVLAASALGAGNLTARAEVRKDDELGQLTGDFNRMAGRIQNQVAEIEASHREMELLYKLVVEVSRNMEVAQVQDAVLKVLHERLKLDRMLFCVETGEKSWTTEQLNADGTSSQYSGSEDFAAMLASMDTKARDALPGVPLPLLRESIQLRQIVEREEGGRWILIMPLEYRGRLAGVLAAIHNVSEDHPAIDSGLLQNLAVHIGLALENALNFTYSITDGLTGLANKRYGLTRLDEALYLSKRQGSPMSLMMLDIDFFKKVNDNHGHQAGDRVLREVARRVRSMNRKSDIAVRYGGEEFMLILPHTPADMLAMLGERFRLAVAGQPVARDDAGNTLAVTLSIGAACHDPQTDSAESLIERADKALYASKAGGRNRVTVAP